MFFDDNTTTRSYWQLWNGPCLQANADGRLRALPHGTSESLRPSTSVVFEINAPARSSVTPSTLAADYRRLSLLSTRHRGLQFPRAQVLYHKILAVIRLLSFSLFCKTSKTAHPNRQPDGDILQNVVNRRAANAGRNRGRLLPRNGTADEVAVGADGDRVGKLAAGGQVSRDVLVERKALRFWGDEFHGYFAACRPLSFSLFYKTSKTTRPMPATQQRHIAIFLRRRSFAIPPAASGTARQQRHPVDIANAV